MCVKTQNLSMEHTNITIQSHSWSQAKSSRDYNKIDNDKLDFIATSGAFYYPASTQSPPTFFDRIGCSTVRRPFRSTVLTGRRGRPLGQQLSRPFESVFQYFRDGHDRRTKCVRPEPDLGFLTGCSTLWGNCNLKCR